MRQAIEHGLLLSQRHVFGVFFWFVVLPGPIGAVVYRLAEHVSRAWNRPPVDVRHRPIALAILRGARSRGSIGRRRG